MSVARPNGALGWVTDRTATGTTRPIRNGRTLAANARVFSRLAREALRAGFDRFARMPASSTATKRERASLHRVVMSATQPAIVPCRWA